MISYFNGESSSERVDCPVMTAVGQLSTEDGGYLLVDSEERVITWESKEVAEAMVVGRQPGLSLTRPCAANVQRAPLLLRWRGGDSRDALSIVGATRHGRRCEPR